MKVKIFQFNSKDDVSIKKFEKDLAQFLNDIGNEAALQGCIISPLIFSTVSDGDEAIFHIVTYNTVRLQPSGVIK